MKRLLTLFLCLFSFASLAAEPGEGGKKSEGFDAGEVILHHVADSHEWHWFSTDNGNFVTYLPIIAYEPGKGVSVFSSKHVMEGETYGNYKLQGEKLVTVDGSKVYDFSITKNVAALAMSSGRA